MLVENQSGTTYSLRMMSMSNTMLGLHRVSELL
jgi:hypothetical protein